MAVMGCIGVSRGSSCAFTPMIRRQTGSNPLGEDRWPRFEIRYELIPLILYGSHAMISGRGHLPSAGGGSDPTARWWRVVGLRPDCGPKSRGGETIFWVDQIFRSECDLNNNKKSSHG